MIRRREFAVAGVSALAATAIRTASADEHDHRSAHRQVATIYEKCAAACSDCQRECDSCASHCAMQLKAGHSSHAETLATCQDCADLCSAASRIVAREGPFANLVCKACAEACAKCAQACEKFPDDQHMAECARECRECEKDCQAMIG